MRILSFPSSIRNIQSHFLLQYFLIFSIDKKNGSNFLKTILSEVKLYRITEYLTSYGYESFKGS